MIAASAFNFLVALTTGLVAATLVPAIRKELPRRLEMAIWLVFVFTCWTAYINVRDPRARILVGDLSWASGQLVRSTAALSALTLVSWLGSHPLVVASLFALGGLAIAIAVRGMSASLVEQAWYQRLLAGLAVLRLDIIDTVAGLRFAAASLAPGFEQVEQAWHQRLVAGLHVFKLNSIDTVDGLRVAAASLAPGLEDARDRAVAVTVPVAANAVPWSAQQVRNLAETVAPVAASAVPWSAEQVRKLAETVAPVASAAVDYAAETYRAQNPIILPNAFLVLPYQPIPDSDEEEDEDRLAS